MLRAHGAPAEGSGCLRGALYRRGALHQLARAPGALLRASAHALSPAGLYFSVPVGRMPAGPVGSAAADVAMGAAVCSALRGHGCSTGAALSRFWPPGVAVGTVAQLLGRGIRLDSHAH